MGNVMTEALLKTSRRMKKVNDRLGEMGKMPYGRREATPAERKLQREIAKEAEMQELLNG